MQKITFILLSLFISTLLWGKPVNQSKKQIGLDGYDAVAFHTEGKAIKGSHRYTEQVGETIYYFSRKENQQLFSKNFERYLPAYGGFCAWGLATKGKLYPIDIDTWQIVDGVLYLNYNQGIKKKFNKDLESLIEAADQAWKEQ